MPRYRKFGKKGHEGRPGIIRILVVEDFAPWRRFISSIIRKKPGWQVVCEVSDGLEAVHKARELTPDLILLDIGLPKLNGMAAARQIREVTPNSKILFLTSYDSSDYTEEVLSTGASGCIAKVDAGGELVRAVEAVLQGRRFVSSRLKGHIAAVADDAQAPARVTPSKVLAWPSAPAVSSRTGITPYHEAHFYSNDESLLDCFTNYVEASLNAGKSAVVFATESHRNNLLSRLEAHHVDVASAIGRGKYFSLDAADTLAKFMVGGLPDRDQFLNAVGSLFTSAAMATKGSPARIAFCAECGPLLWAQGDGEAAIRLERLLNEVIDVHDLEVLCSYPWRGLHSEEDGQVFRKICAEHSALYSW